MVLDIIFLSLAFAGLIAATIVDIKKREVPDLLNYGLIFTAAGIRILDIIINKNLDALVITILSFIGIFVIANLMYLSRQWGGGDAKLLMALSIIFSQYPKSLEGIFSPNLNVFPFILILFINILLIGSIYGLVYSLFLAYKQKDKFMKEIKIISKEKSIRSLKLITFLIAVVILITITSFNLLTSALAITSLTFIVLFPYILMLVRTVEKISMFHEINISKLTEGDWIAHDIKIRGKKIYNKNSPGITKSQIITLKSSKIKTVIVKEGIPFVPSFLLATIFSLIVGFPFPI